MESGKRPRTRKLIGCCGIPLLLFATSLFALWWFCGPGVGWRYMAPYRSLVARHATEKQAIKEIGKPSEVYRTKAEFYDHSGHDVARLWAGGPVYMDYADPWQDGEGFVVYLAFDAEGRATGTLLVQL